LPRAWCTAEAPHPGLGDAQVRVGSQALHASGAVSLLTGIYQGILLIAEAQESTGNLVLSLVCKRPYIPSRENILW
jgi:hypothetical protein